MAEEVVWLGGCGRAGRLRGCCCGCYCARTTLGEVCCGRGCVWGDERCRRCVRGRWTNREGRRFPWMHVAAERHLGVLFVDKAAQRGGGEWGLPPADEAMERPRKSSHP